MKQQGLDAEVVYVQDIKEFAKYGVFMTPALVVRWRGQGGRQGPQGVRNSEMVVFLNGIQRYREAGWSLCQFGS